ncbi:MAG TPA: head GIN domain-containing protein [Chitinophagaceae bacterium]|jgi:hypothetical protein|nr:head GIN domain-containing protein [Chitinophagaceae bacterium]
MKKSISIIAILLLTVTSNAQKTINDANAEVRSVKSFNGIIVSSAFDVYVTQGTEEAVAVSAADPADRANITVTVEKGVLVIGLNKDGRRWRGNRHLKAYISFKQIDLLAASGACNVYLESKIKADILSVNLSGATDLKRGVLDVDHLKVDISGASDMKVTGVATRLTVEASGASAFKGEDLVTETCDAKASGASDIRITVNKELTAQASGASDVKYKGNGVIRDIKTSGASGIRRI